MHGERVGLGTHFFQSGHGLLKCFAEVFEGVLKPVCSHVFICTYMQTSVNFVCPQSGETGGLGAPFGQSLSSELTV